MRRRTASVEAKGWRQRSGTESDLSLMGGLGLQIVRLTVNSIVPVET